MTLGPVGLYFLVGALISPTFMVWRIDEPDRPPMWEVLLAGALFVPVWPVVTFVGVLLLADAAWHDLRDYVSSRLRSK